MQDDDTANPAMLWVLEGETLWSAKAANGKSCADCHGDGSASMKGVAARYPAFDTASATSRSISSSASTLPRRAPERDAACAFESRESARADGLRRAPVAGHADRTKRSAHAAGHRERPRAVRRHGRASSICRARSATTTIGARNSPAASSRRRIRPDIRSIDWSGRVSDRCSGACATACSASAPSFIRSARRT